MVPMRVGTKEDGESVLSCPFELFYKRKPNMRTLFKFGSVGFFKKDRDGNHHRTKMQVQTYPGIALGRSDTTNGMLFWSPETCQMSVSADYKLDTSKQVRNFFPDLLNDGGFDLHYCSADDVDSSAVGHPIGSTVFFQLPGPINITGEPVVGQGKVTSVPTRVRRKYYGVLMEDGTHLKLLPEELWDPDDCFAGPNFVTSDPSEGDPIHPTLPAWLKPNQKVGYHHKGERLLGTLQWTEDFHWCFAQTNSRGQRILEVPLPDLEIFWRQFLSEGSLEVGWEHSSPFTANVDPTTKASSNVGPDQGTPNSSVSNDTSPDDNQPDSDTVQLPDWKDPTEM